MKLNKKFLPLISGIFLSILFLFLAVRHVNISQTIELIAGTNYFFIFPAALCFFTDFTLRAVRWRILISPIKKCKFSNLLSITYIGFFATGVLPMRMGELIRVLMVGKKEHISKASAVGTIAVERTMDIFAILFLLSLTFFVYPYPDQVQRIWILGIAVFVMCISFLYSIIFFRRQTLNVVRFFIKIFPDKIKNKIEKLLNFFISGLYILKKPDRFFITLTLSLLVWLANASLYFFIAKGMGIPQITLYGAIFIMSVIAVGISVPSSPGFIGVYEYFGILACGILGVQKSAALSFILLVHTIQFIVLTAAGMSFLAKENISLFKLEKEAKKEKENQ
jgi:uncharacterized protein (TIRG00374 family)